jgi:hypothetical protein
VNTLERHAGERRRRVVAAVAAVPLAAAIAVTTLQTAPVEAAWGDAEFSRATVTAIGMTAPTKTTCANNLGLSASFSWTNPTTGAPRTGYVFAIYRQGVLQASANLAAGATSASTSGLLTTLLGGVTYEVRLQAVNNAWASTAVSGTFSTTLAGLISGCTW